MAIYSPEQLLTLPEAACYELVAGQLRERNMGAQSQWIAGLLFALLWEHVRRHQLGWVFAAEVGYCCFGPDKDRVRRPDVSFIRGDRMSWADLPPGHLTIPPDLAVEVVSPGDGADDLETKIAEYLQGGVRLIWVLFPATQRVQVTRQDGRGVILASSDALTGDDVLPGFDSPIAALFAPPPGVPER